MLNVSCKEYTRREKYFKYLNLEIYDETTEDAKKYFRITNRFINEALNAAAAGQQRKLSGEQVAVVLDSPFSIRRSSV